ncbi:phage terminase small subunit-related protein [Paenibacillus qinlingensis]
MEDEENEAATILARQQRQTKAKAKDIAAELGLGETQIRKWK